jgi:ParB family chromosome partitioning protein
MPKKVLGKGLSAILPDPAHFYPPVAPVAPSAAAAAPAPAVESLEALQQAAAVPLGRAIHEVPLDRVDPNPLQPRRHFDADKLSELTRSVAQEGVLQPVLLTRKGDRYQIVAGERRARACREAGMETISAILTEVDDSESLKLALVENLQRDDLNPMEEARAYQVMIQEFGWTQEELGAYLGRDRSTVSNTLRLLQLPDEVQDMVARGSLSAGHVRALIKLEREDSLELARLVERRHLSVRQAERLAGSRKGPRRRGQIPPLPEDPVLRRIREGLEERFGLPVQLQYARGSGKVSVRFGSDRELERIMQVLGVSLDGDF